VPQLTRGRASGRNNAGWNNNSQRPKPVSLTIARKIYAALGAILFIFLVMFGLLLRASYEQTTSFAERYRNDVEAGVQLSKAQDALWRLRYGFPEFLAHEYNPAERRKIIDDEPGLHAAIAEALERFEKTGIDAQQQKALMDLRTAYRQYAEARPKWFQLVSDGKAAEAADWRAKTTTPHGAGTVKGFNDLLASSQQGSARHITLLRDAAERTQIATVGMFLIGAVLALVAAVWLVRLLVPRLKEARRAAERVAQGDLTGRIARQSGDEAGQLLNAIARMNAGLAGVVTQVRSSADAVVSAASQVAAGTTDLSQRTEEQASSLEETAASMEELASTVNQNADNARQADDLARNVSQRAEQGGAEVGRAVATMNEVSQSAGRIADIISVIDAIAFQTNILALNAAVEAARAGEQGRGFAVVASEVRSLAQRSAQAAKEIKGLIHDAVERSRNGTVLVEQAGQTIHALVHDVRRVSDLMGSIAQASAEQSRGVQQVNRTVTEMDRVVQQNAAAVQQAAAAAESMRGHARQLYDAVATFRLEQRPTSAVREPSMNDLLDSLSGGALAYAGNRRLSAS
jgi:methyl-accepting chemotaxis protein